MADPPSSGDTPRGRYRDPGEKRYLIDAQVSTGSTAAIIEDGVHSVPLVYLNMGGASPDTEWEHLSERAR